MARRQREGREGVSSPGRRNGKASVPLEEGVGSRQFPMKEGSKGISFPGEGVGRHQFSRENIWEGASSPGKRCRKASVPQAEGIGRCQPPRETTCVLFSGGCFLGRGPVSWGVSSLGRDLFVAGFSSPGRWYWDVNSQWEGVEVCHFPGCERVWGESACLFEMTP